MSFYDKEKARKHFQEQKAQAFRCGHCRSFVVFNEHIGTANRNHCNFCLWSKHVDIEKGDRNASCQSGMQPIGLTFKHEGYTRIGEIMLVHLCVNCQKISINRIAGDDDVNEIVQLFENSKKLDISIRKVLEQQSIVFLTEEDRGEVEVQLFGK